MRKILLFIALLVAVPACSFASVVYSIPENLSLSGTVDTRGYVYVGQDGEVWDVISTEFNYRCTDSEKSQKVQEEVHNIRVKVENKFRELSDGLSRRKNAVFTSVSEDIGDGATLLAFSYESMFHSPGKKELRTQLEFYIFWKDNSIAKGTVMWVGEMGGKLQGYLKRLASTKKQAQDLVDQDLLRAQGHKCPADLSEK